MLGSFVRLKGNSFYRFLPFACLLCLFGEWKLLICHRNIHKFACLCVQMRGPMHSEGNFPRSAGLRAAFYTAQCNKRSSLADHIAPRPIYLILSGYAASMRRWGGASHSIWPPIFRYASRNCTVTIRSQTMINDCGMDANPTWNPETFGRNLEVRIQPMGTLGRI